MNWQSVFDSVTVIVKMKLFVGL